MINNHFKTDLERKCLLSLLFLIWILLIHMHIDPMSEFNKIFFRLLTHILYKQYILFLKMNEMKI